MLKQNLSQKLLQKLSPQQIQFIKLLQLNTLNFEQRVEEELIDNPALESGKDGDGEDFETQPDFEADERHDDFDISDYLTGDEGGIKLSEDYNGNDDDDDRESIPVISYDSFRETLFDSVSVVLHSEHECQIAEQLIGTIDDDGYLRRPLRAIVNDLLFSSNIRTTEEELEKILHIIQQFDPPGIGATSLQECLLLQLKRKEEKSNNPILKLAHQILANYMEDFSKKHYNKLIKKLDVTEDYLKEAIDLIIKLNPKPADTGNAGTAKTEYIIPDFIVKESHGELEVTLNSRNAPELKISRSYMETMKAYDKSPNPDRNIKDAVQFIKQKLDGAKWFIDSVKQRQNTLLSTMRTIVALQRNFFLNGDESDLRPMILKDVADRIGMDISTISRVANSKYVEMEFGIFQLKYFFSEGITTDTGEEVSNKEVKRILQDAIEAEDKRVPLTDEKLMEILKEKGYVIARRTVAKYREQLNIPVARLRKEL
jgi:RNA polymerase sigma-54 factor